MLEPYIKAKCQILIGVPNLLSCIFETKYAQKEFGLSDILASLTVDELKILKNNVDLYINIKEIGEYKEKMGIE